MNKAVVTLIVAIGALVPTAFSFAATTTIYATSVGTGNHDDPSNPYSSAGTICAVGHLAASDNWVCWISFPEWASGTISGVTLHLDVFDDGGVGANTAKIHRVKKATDDDATCNNYDGTSAWETICGFGASDYYSTEIGSQSIDTEIAYDVTLDPGSVETMLQSEKRLGVYPNNPGSGDWRKLISNNQGLFDPIYLEITYSTSSATSTFDVFPWSCEECMDSPWAYLISTTSTFSDDYLPASADIFGDYLNTILDTSTSTIPGCYITKAGETLDTLIGLVGGNGNGSQGNSWTLEIGGNDFSLDLRPWRSSFPDWLEDLITFERTVAAFALWGMAGFAMWRDWIGGDEHSSNS